MRLGMEREASCSSNFFPKILCRYFEKVLLNVHVQIKFNFNFQAAVRCIGFMKSTTLML